MSPKVSIMSFNIRFDNPNEADDDKWEKRRTTCSDIINKYKPALIGLQEPHKHQVEQIAEMCPNYSWFGTGRYIQIFGLNAEHNELNPVLFDKTVLTLEASGTFWYSDTPIVPMTKWPCSAFPRIATWGRFSVNATGERLCFINTHFDHESEEARTKAADLLLAILPEVTQGLPTAICATPALKTLKSSLMECSTAGCATLPGLLGKCATFVGFDKTIDSEIDFIFTCQGLKPSGYGTIPDECPNGRCCSDHRPIMAEVEFVAGGVPLPGRADAPVVTLT
ncbi:hypothetical protein Rsub_10015 [Raphidocelis subcapitata]|uniref:Endonuclease/exonuclease/phosphatase domain-containing protein n=1 Tax=Raphidocelis subcapitata TaxID=307507 RepID=A0A2V0PBU6_9CHLO|nr:hypothetical protein Rsub_10015 [Raphidocelis subcapitata]|eukprot:GBF97324.1 hypothetical protein Rsub_10015 [Raphidocelis subcapitata]